MYVGHQLTNQIKVWIIANLYTKYNRKTSAVLTGRWGAGTCAGGSEVAAMFIV